MFHQEEEKEKRRRADEEAKLDTEALRRLRESEIQVQQHESAKTAHYARLGASFARGKFSFPCPLLPLAVITEYFFFFVFNFLLQA